MTVDQDNQDQIDAEALNPTPGVWKVNGKEYHLLPPKLRHVAAIMRMQKAFKPLEDMDPDDDFMDALGSLKDEDMTRIENADKDFESVILELAKGMTEEDLEEIGMIERMDAIGIIGEKMGSADTKGLAEVGAKPSKKKKATAPAS